MKHPLIVALLALTLVACDSGTSTLTTVDNTPVGASPAVVAAPEPEPTPEPAPAPEPVTPPVAAPEPTPEPVAPPARTEFAGILESDCYAVAGICVEGFNDLDMLQAMAEQVKTRYETCPVVMSPSGEIPRPRTLVITEHSRAGTGVNAYFALPDTIVLEFWLPSRHGEYAAELVQAADRAYWGEYTVEVRTHVTDLPVDNTCLRFDYWDRQPYTYLTPLYDYIYGGPQ